MRPGLLWLGLLVASGCGSGQPVRPPFQTGARSGLLSLLGPGSDQVFAIDLLSETPLRIELGPDEARGDLRVTAVSYQEPLAKLGLMEGRVASDPNGGALPSLPLAIFDLDRESGEPSWQAVDQLPPELEAFRIPQRCVPLQITQQWSSRGASNISGIAMFSDGQAGWVLGHTGFPNDWMGICRVDEDFALDRPCSLEIWNALSGVYARAIKPDAHGVQWLVGGGPIGARIASWDGDAQTQPQVLTSSVVGLTYTKLAFDAGSDDMYLLDDRGGLSRQRGGQLELLRPRVHFSGPELGAIVRNGPGDFFLARAGVGGIERFHNGESTLETSELDGMLSSGERILSFVVTSRGEVFAGSHGGVILRREENGHWRQFAAPFEAGAEVWDMAAYGDGGFITAQANGILAQYDRHTKTFCDGMVRTGVDTALFNLQVDGDHVWAAGSGFVTPGMGSVLMLRLDPVSP